MTEKEKDKIDLFLFGDGKLIQELSPTVRLIQGSRALRLIATPFQEVKQAKKHGDLLYRLSLTGLVRLIGSKRLYDYIFQRQQRLGTYDMAISYFSDVPHAYFNQGTNQFVSDHIYALKKIAWVHTDPIQARYDKKRCLELYREFDTIVCVSNACSENFKLFLPEYAHKVKTVYNFFPIADIQKKSEENGALENFLSDLSLITVTRIDNGSKNLGRILEVCKKLEAEGIRNYKWCIIGDGPDLEKNRKDVIEAGLTKRVQYMGAKSNPYPYMANSDLFVLTSNYEGFPMVIQEAFILGLPVLTTPYAAVKEQVRDGVTGIIADMCSESLFKHLKRIIQDPTLLDDLREGIKRYPVSNEKARQQLKRVMEG